MRESYSYNYEELRHWLKDSDLGDCIDYGTRQSGNHEESRISIKINDGSVISLSMIKVRGYKIMMLSRLRIPESNTLIFGESDGRLYKYQQDKIYNTTDIWNIIMEWTE